jgi:hypothetical protein
MNFDNGAAGAQGGSGTRGQGYFYTIYGSGNSASSMTAWTWAVSRIIDALETTPGANINTKKIGVTGCSRNGKGALMIGAFETRIALTIPQESGSGGDACLCSPHCSLHLDTDVAHRLACQQIRERQGSQVSARGPDCHRKPLVLKDV